MLKRLILLTFLITPFIAWHTYKPMRVIAPQWNGVSCVTDKICIESPDKSDEAILLYESAVVYVDEFVGKLKQTPRITFCTSVECFAAFGSRAPAKAKTVGLSGIVIGPNGWENHIIRHEIIHHLQSEQLGIIRQWRSPPWFKEGMAYYLSDDTRSLTEPFKGYRDKFENWYRQVGKEHMWESAKTL